MVLIFVPVVIAAIVLFVVQRRTRRRGEDLPIAAAIGTGIVLGFVVAAVVGGLLAIALFGGPDR